MERPGAFLALEDQSLHLQKASLHKVSGEMCNVEDEEDNLDVFHFFSQIQNKLFLSDL